MSETLTKVWIRLYLKITYPNGDTQSEPVNTWRSNANLFYGNWLNYQVYQNTPYDINKIGEKMSLRSDSYEADED